MEDLRSRTGRSGLEIVSVNVWEGTGAYAEARGFCELWGVDGTVLVDEHGELAGRLGIRGVPANVFVDSDGTVTAVGAATPAELVAATRRLLGPAAPASLAGLGEQARASDEEDIERHITSWDQRMSPEAAGPDAGSPCSRPTDPGRTESEDL
jgi:thioredoxin-like negative regulator of GroEL